jgi:predicted metalloprotease with PDZ domain
MIRPWIFLFIQFEPFAPWFKGGFATYYENMTAAQRYGLDNIIDRRFKPMYKYYIDNIAGPPEVDKKNSWNHNFLQYYKPCLTAYYIDQLLKENSGGAKTIDDLMKVLFQKAEQGVAINREIFTEALNSLTSYDFTSVVENYLVIVHPLH